MYFPLVAPGATLTAVALIVMPGGASGMTMIESRAGARIIVCVARVTGRLGVYRSPAPATRQQCLWLRRRSAMLSRQTYSLRARQRHRAGRGAGLPLTPLTAIVAVNPCAVVMLGDDGVTATAGVARLTVKVPFTVLTE